MTLKDIHEVNDNQLLSLSHVRCRGVAARAGSVHLIYSVDQKLGQKGRARTRPQQHHPVPQGGPFSKKFRPTTRSPQTMPIVQHSLVNIKRHTMMSMTFHHNHTTHFLRGWSESTSTQSTTFHTLTASSLCHLGPPPH